MTRTDGEQGSRCLTARNPGGRRTGRVTAAFKRLWQLDGVHVTGVEFRPTMIVVAVALRRRRLVRGHCGHKTSARYDTRPVESRWRHLDLGAWRMLLPVPGRCLASVIPWWHFSGRRDVVDRAGSRIYLSADSARYGWSGHPFTQREQGPVGEMHFARLGK